MLRLTMPASMALAFGHLQAVHDGAYAVTREDAHQRVVQAQVEAAGAGVALAAGTAAQLVVDAAAFVAFGRHDAQAAGGLHLVVQGLPLVLELLRALLALGVAQRRVFFEKLDLLLDVATQHDVGAPPGHVGGNGDHARPAGLGHDLGLLGMLLGVQHLVRQLRLGQQLADELAVFDAGGAHQHRLATFMAVANVFRDGVVLLFGRLVDEVVVVLADGRPVGRDDHRFQAVDLLEFIGFRVGRARHAAELAVHAEVVLEGHRGQRLVLALDLHTFLGFHGLVQAVAPAPARHQAAGELIDDDHFAVLHDVMLVTVVEVVGPQRRIDVVHQRDVGRVIQARALSQQAGLQEQLLGLFVAGFGEEHLVRLFVDGEVASVDDTFAGAHIGFADLLLQPRDDGVDAHIHLGVIFGLAADDQWRARFVDEDGVDLVDDGVVQATCNAVAHVLHHVVAQVVEAELVVGAVGDVGGVGGLLLFAAHPGHVHAHGQAEKGVQAPHPLGIAARQVVVHRHHVHTLAGECIQVDGQRGHQRLAFAGAHLGDLALVQRDAAYELHVEVAHLQCALAAFAHHRKSFRQDVVERGPGGHTLAELIGLGAQVGVGQLLELGFQRVDGLHDAPVRLQETLVPAAENLGQDLGEHAASGVSWFGWPAPRRRRFWRADGAMKGAFCGIWGRGSGYQAVRRTPKTQGRLSGHAKRLSLSPTLCVTGPGSRGRTGRPRFSAAALASCPPPHCRPGNVPGSAARHPPALRSAGGHRSSGRCCPLGPPAGHA